MLFRMLGRDGVLFVHSQITQLQTCIAWVFSQTSTSPLFAAFMTFLNFSEICAKGSVRQNRTRILVRTKGKRIVWRVSHMHYK